MDIHYPEQLERASPLPLLPVNLPSTGRGHPPNHIKTDQNGPQVEAANKVQQVKNKVKRGYTCKNQVKNPMKLFTTFTPPAIKRLFTNHLAISRGALGACGLRKPPGAVSSRHKRNLL